VFAKEMKPASSQRSKNSANLPKADIRVRLDGSFASPEVFDLLD